MSDWGKRKRSIVFTLMGNVTEKQAEKIFARMLKIASKYDLGADYGES